MRTRRRQEPSRNSVPRKQFKPSSRPESRYVSPLLRFTIIFKGTGSIVPPDDFTTASGIVPNTGRERGHPSSQGPFYSPTHPPALRK